MALTVTVMHAHAFLLGQKIGMMVRVMCTDAIYQKVSWGEVGRGDERIVHL